MILVAGSRDAPLATASSGNATLIGVHQDVVANSYDYAQAAITAARDVLGAQVSRSTLRWNIVEPTRNEFDWSHADFVVGRLKVAGIEPLFTLLGSPPWANGVGANVPGHEFYVPTDQASFDRWLTELTAFARAAARRYRDDVHLWEVWNEPNEHFFWLPEPNGARYAQVYRALSDAIHSENSAARVAVGGLAGVGAGCCISGLEFTRSLVAAGVPMDAVALHPYPSNGHAPDVHVAWQDNFDDIGAVRQLLDTSERSKVEVWVTEWGWSSSAVGLDTQAAYVRKSLEMLRDQYPYVTVATLFLDADRPGQYDYGLLRSDFSPKLAGAAVADFMRDRSSVPQTPASPSSAPPAAPTPAPRDDSQVPGGSVSPVPATSPSAPTSSDGSRAPSGTQPTTSASPVTAPVPAPIQSTPQQSKQQSKQSVRLVGSRLSLTPSPARAGSVLVASMHVGWNHRSKSPLRGSITGTARIGKRWLKLVNTGWNGPVVRVKWRVPVGAKGKRITGAITVRYHGATTTKSFSASVR